MPIHDWSLALQWADDIDEKIVNECLKKDVIFTECPRISATLSSLSQVETHFRNESEITEITLNLYHNMLKCTKPEVIAFLRSVHENTSDELFFDMPSELISSMKGKPCRSRDHEKLKHLVVPSQLFSKYPTLLVSNTCETALFIKGKLIQKINKGGLLCVLPTDNLLEQFVILCNNDQCSLLSVTRHGIIETCEFDLPINENSKIEWIDAVRFNDHILLFWGGIDALRGQPSWSYSTAIDPFKLTDLFYELDYADKIANKIFSECAYNQDYTKHGNVLTLWKRYEESEEKNHRKWVLLLSIQSTTEKIADCLPDTMNVWGSPQQYVVVSKNKISTYLCGVKQNEFDLHFDVHNLCVLYSHSR
jgi:hypothetical protein